MLELKNSSGDVIESWSDSEGERVVDNQVAYMIWDILHDPAARASLVWGSQSYAYGFVVPGVETASKTGTTTTTNSNETKDSLMISVSSAISTVVWNGNHDGSGLRNSDNSIVRRVVNNYMEGVHKDVYAEEGKWHSGDTPSKPSGLQTLSVNGKTDIWPSWFNASKNSGVAKETLVFNRYNHNLASSCTPEEYKIEVEVTKVTDPMTGKDVYNVPEPYDRDTSDPCDYQPPKLALSVSGNNVIATIRKGTYDIEGYTLYVNGVEQGGVSLGPDGSFYTLKGTENSVKLVISDTAGYTVSEEMTFTPSNKENKTP